jgi:hypothetical protein
MKAVLGLVAGLLLGGLGFGRDHTGEDRPTIVGTH